ncbi:Uncharacterized conserved protein, contains FIST_N domain [Poseidonocella pacifica]|uniref:Uncharacterized conserved protein, contains FIST_N domain n=1 Tax=Poseidonocella pacifica TaxID=871651 RepID=A0A1I0YIU8_9RHOB|nr:FIST N-terminal domain-containing protein [Poseidonocella pacifica]SFB12278.1 Uncharacterized conserved protein, contains FIST_N domain [Poseidonocella pacifica]
MLNAAPPVAPLFGIAVSRAETAEDVVREMSEALIGRDICFLLVFVPDRLELAEMAPALNRHFSGIPVFGCTTAGQIAPDTGYDADALVAIAFPKRHFRCASMLIDPLNPLPIKEISTNARRLAAQFQRTADWNRLALIFADGLSRQEDLLVAALATALDDLPLFGGSAGHALRFDETHVLHGGQFHRDAALLLLLETDLEYAGLGFDHFLPTDKHMVVTEAIPEERVVLELNGAPAAQEYARLVGCDVDRLSPEVFAENPVLVRNSSMYHVRAIQKVHQGGALAFFSAIDDGLLLTLGEGQEVLRTLEEGLGLKDAAGRPPEMILGFDCFLRLLEIETKAMRLDASEILKRHRVVGFNTYGEQHCGVHVNQTFVGVAFFQPRRRDLH